MLKYNNGNGKSGITAYAIGNDYIDIKFRNGKVYRYRKDRIGELNFLNMKVSAILGSGLNTFINKFVRGKHC